MKAKKLAQKIVDDALSLALIKQQDPVQRIKAYRMAANELLEMASDMAYEVSCTVPKLSDDK